MSAELIGLLIALASVLLGGIALGLRLLVVTTAVARQLATMQSILDHRGPVIKDISDTHRHFRANVYEKLGDHETRIKIMEKTP